MILKNDKHCSPNFIKSYRLGLNGVLNQRFLGIMYITAKASIRSYNTNSHSSENIFYAILKSLLVTLICALL